MTWLWGGPDQTSDDECDVDDGKGKSTSNDTNSQPAGRLEDVPIDDEKGGFDEEIGNVTEPVTQKAQLKGKIERHLSTREGSLP